MCGLLEREVGCARNVVAGGVHVQMKTRTASGQAGGE